MNNKINITELLDDSILQQVANQYVGHGPEVDEGLK